MKAEQPLTTGNYLIPYLYGSSLKTSMHSSLIMDAETVSDHWKLPNSILTWLITEDFNAFRHDEIFKV
jgi:hypothetical protein